jgi:hypothetical protein
LTLDKIKASKKEKKQESFEGGSKKKWEKVIN